MSLYEQRIYDVKVGQMPEAQRLYREIGWPALDKGGHAKRLVGYFVSDTGALHQLMHLWKYEDDAERRAHWAGVFADAEFMRFATQFRPLVNEQRVQLFTAAPWGPHP